MHLTIPACYETTKPRFAVFDYDNSVESHALTGYLSKTCTKTDIKNDKKKLCRMSFLPEM